MKSLLRNNRCNIGLVIGNGINRYDAAETTNSWQDLLISLAEKHLPENLHRVPPGITLTEFYDVLELKPVKSDSEKSLQQEFVDLMASWKPYDHHKRIIGWARGAKAPILTTNFERVMAEAGSCSLHRTKKGGFTDYYPWENYYSDGPINDPSNEFAIWHVNGMQKYYRSIRLGLTHYMGSVERARKLIHKGNLFSRKNAHEWQGATTWLHVVFNTPLLIFGLGLEENEVFLRWLLIERARYFKKFPDRKKDAWYIHFREFKTAGKKFFLEGVGIQAVQAANYDEIYGASTWE
jgi:hypothetical protein